MNKSQPINTVNSTRYAPFWAAISLGLLGSAGQGFSVITALTESAPVRIVANVQASSTKIETVDLAAITELHLFGTIITDRSIDISAIPATTLNLTLSGIIAGAHMDTSRALISEGGKPSKAYFKNDTLADGAKLHSINSNFVIMQRGERLEKLSLYRIDTQSGAPTRSDRAIATAENVAVSPPTEPLMAPPPEKVYKSLDERIAAIKKNKS